LNKDEIEAYRQFVESMLVAITQEAENWAAEGSMRDGERAFYPVPKGAIQL